jgi:GcrA cell cycle regulator
VTDSGWTTAHELRLKDLWAAGRTAKEIMEDLPFSRSAILGKVHRMKLPARHGDGAQVTVRQPSTRAAPKPKPGKVSSMAPNVRRNPTNSLTEKLALAEYDPGLALLKSEKPDGTGIQLRDLNELNCHWPKGDPLQADFEFCGAKALPGMPYCPHHSRMSYAPPRERVRQDKWAFLGTDKLR